MASQVEVILRPEVIHGYTLRGYGKVIELSKFVLSFMYCNENIILESINPVESCVAVPSAMKDFTSFFTFSFKSPNSLVKFCCIVSACNVQHIVFEKMTLILIELSRFDYVNIRYTGCSHNLDTWQKHNFIQL